MWSDGFEPTSEAGSFSSVKDNENVWAITKEIGDETVEVVYHREIKVFQDMWPLLVQAAVVPHSAHQADIMGRTTPAGTHWSPLRLHG